LEPFSQMSAPDGKMGQTIVEGDSEQTIRAIVNGLGGSKVAAASRFTTQP
jgi:hypothetical protein